MVRGKFDGMCRDMQNFGSMMNDAYETEFKNMKNKPDGKKIMYKNGVPVNQNQKGNNNNNKNNINQDNDPFGFVQMS